MGFGIDLHARSRKGRGLFRRAPDPREVGSRLAWLVRRMLRDVVARAATKQDRYVAELQFHPAAPVATLSVQADAELVLRAETSGIGPGYHAHVIERIAPVLDELDYVWTEAFDLAGTQAAMCAWLAGELQGETRVRVGMPQNRTFRVDAPVQTVLGPRDAAWRDAVRADPLRAADAFPWWDVGPGRAERSRALIAMSLEVPWREPLDQDERELMIQIDEDLRAARKADPALALPWPEWKEMLAHLGIEDEDVNEKAGDAKPVLGYRRADLDVELSGGWWVCQPASMVSHWEDEGAKYWATDGERAIEFSSLTAPDEQDSAKLLAVAPERYPVVERLVEGHRHGRVEAFEDKGVPVMICLMTDAPHVGILTCKGGTREWAIATWRSLRRHD